MLTVRMHTMMIPQGCFASCLVLASRLKHIFIIKPSKDSACPSKFELGFYQLCTWRHDPGPGNDTGSTGLTVSGKFLGHLHVADNGSTFP